MDLNKDARTFVRLVIGLSTTKEEELGLDTSIHWTTNTITGIKESGTVEALDKYGKLVPYKLDIKQPPFIRTTVRGRGTTCWFAFHPETQEKVIIKDCWREAKRRPESEYLEAAFLIPGVVKLISWDDDRAQTKDIKYRPAGMAAVCVDFRNYIKSRTVLRASGKALHEFQTRHEVIAAFRDIVCGENTTSSDVATSGYSFHLSAHGEIFAKGILHRDIKLANLRIGDPEAPVGDRGMVLDFDAAIWVDREQAEICEGYRSVGLMLLI